MAITFQDELAKNPLVLGPMAGVTDLPFRILCREMGCGILYTEMVSAKAIYYNNKNTKPLLHTMEQERPIAVQLFGSEPQLMADMAKKIEDAGFDFIDINMGCPVPKVVNNQEGSALMKQPLLVGEIVEKMVKAVKLPVSVKIRKGFDENSINAPEIAYIAQESGAQAVAVHGRTREEYYAGKADWDIIRQVKEKVKIPVIASGDIVDAKSLDQVKKITNCDGFMIARGAKGNPWIFKELSEHLNGNDNWQKPSLDEVIEMILRHGLMMVEEKGEYTAMREMRKHVAWYTAGYKNSAALRRIVNQIETYDDLCTLMEQYRS